LTTTEDFVKLFESAGQVKLTEIFDGTVTRSTTWCSLRGSPIGTSFSRCSSYLND
jgi:hypothetical protein